MSGKDRPAQGVKGTGQRNVGKKQHADYGDNSARIEALGAGRHPAPLTLPEKFQDEDKKMGWRAPSAEKFADTFKESAIEKYGADGETNPEFLQQMADRHDRESNSSKFKTRYFDEAEQQRNTLSPRSDFGDASLEDAEGRLATTKDVRGNNGPAEYAMSPEGRIVANMDRVGESAAPGWSPESERRHEEYLLGGSQSNETTHHSSYLAGGDVAHAGHIGVESGKVNYLDDDSGHYKPTAEHTTDAFDRLAADGVLDPHSQMGRVKMIPKHMDKSTDFLRHGGREEYRAETLDVHFSAFNQARGNEKGMRHKSKMLDEFTQKTEEGDALIREGEAPVLGNLSRTAPTHASAEVAEDSEQEQESFKKQNAMDSRFTLVEETFESAYSPGSLYSPEFGDSPYGARDPYELDSEEYVTLADNHSPWGSDSSDSDSSDSDSDDE